jgi:hypothetical protein
MDVFMKRYWLLWTYLQRAYYDWKCNTGKHAPPMTRYDDDQVTFDPRIVKIIVADEQSKAELVAASEYIHYRDIDTDFKMVNTLAHLYQCPELIEVQQ